MFLYWVETACFCHTECRFEICSSTCFFWFSLYSHLQNILLFPPMTAPWSSWWFIFSFLFLTTNAIFIVKTQGSCHKQTFRAINCLNNQSNRVYLGHKKHLPVSCFNICWELEKWWVKTKGCLTHLAENIRKWTQEIYRYIRFCVFGIYCNKNKNWPDCLTQKKCVVLKRYSVLIFNILEQKHACISMRNNKPSLLIDRIFADTFRWLQTPALFQFINEI